jgi:hypothetical protein
MAGNCRLFADTTGDEGKLHRVNMSSGDPVAAPPGGAVTIGPHVRAMETVRQGKPYFWQWTSDMIAIAVPYCWW